jgi:hypothetical protein
MTELFALLFGLAAPDYTGAVAVQAAYVIHTQREAAPVQECCGLCNGGIIVHGDGHTTPCPCPPECPCKKRLKL